MRYWREKARGDNAVAFVAKMQWFFSNPPNLGFSEVWYSTAPDYASAMTLAKRYLNVRKELLGFGAFCIGIRVSDDTVKGDSQVYVPQPKEGSSTVYTAADDQADKAGMACLTRCEATPLHRRMFMLRGAPDALFDTRFPTGIDPGFHGWLAGFQTFGLLLASNQFTVRHRTAIGPPPTYQFVAVTSVVFTEAAYRKPSRPFGLPRGRRLA